MVFLCACIKENWEAVIIFNLAVFGIVPVDEVLWLEVETRPHGGYTFVVFGSDAELRER